MVAKEELVSWFKNLESYKRIDVMCSLLNLCLPFELRFLGTCLEELGRRDAPDLRGAELRVNNPQEFNNEVGSFQSGQPTDWKMRRKMALFLALMRACSRTGVTELFKTLDRWGDSDFSKINEGDAIQELLLVYTMASNHPVFNFSQRLRCGEIYSKISAGRGHLNQQSPPATSPITTPLASSTFSVQHHPTNSPPPSFTSATFQQPPQQIINPLPTPIMMAYSPAPGISSLIQTSDPSAPIALNVETLPSHLGVPPQMMQIPTDFTSPPWQVRYAPPPQLFPVVQMDTQFPPPSTSPHLSQPPSPTHSRTGSPTRQQHNQVQQTSSQAQQQQQQMMPNPVTQSAHRNNRPIRNVRPSAETTPPPLQQQQQQSVHQQTSQGSGTIYMGNDIMNQTIKNFEEINMEGAISQLQSLRNGYNRPPNTIPRQNNKQNWTAMHANVVPVAVPGSMNYTMHMVEQNPLPTNMKRSGMGSDSGGSSTGEASPPPLQLDPSTGLLGNANQTQSSGSLRPLNLSRLNGGKHGGVGGSSTGANNNNNNIDFNNGSQSNVSALVTSSSSGNLSLLIGGQMHNFPGYRTMPPPQRHFQGQPNGELMYSFTQPFLPTQTPVVVSNVSQRASPSAVPVPTPYPTNKSGLSCFNCGSTTHTGLNCSEASMEDVTRNAVYKLDYTINAPQLQFIPAGTMSAPASSGNLNQMNTIQPANNNELDTTITFIDLTQDSTSSSSSSSTSSIHGAK